MEQSYAKMLELLEKDPGLLATLTELAQKQDISNVRQSSPLSSGMSNLSVYTVL